jgi:hypothetical protein
VAVCEACSGSGSVTIPCPECHANEGPSEGGDGYPDPSIMGSGTNDGRSLTAEDYIMARSRRELADIRSESEADEFLSSARRQLYALAHDGDPSRNGAAF